MIGNCPCLSSPATRIFLSLSLSLSLSLPPSLSVPISLFVSLYLSFFSLSHRTFLSVPISFDFSIILLSPSATFLQLRICHILFKSISVSVSHTVSYCPILSHTLSYSPILSHTLPYSPILSHSLPFSISLALSLLHFSLILSVDFLIVGSPFFYFTKKIILQACTHRYISSTKLIHFPLSLFSPFGIDSNTSQLKNPIYWTESILNHNIIVVVRMYTDTQTHTSRHSKHLSTFNLVISY